MGKRAVWATGGRVRAVFVSAIERHRVTGIAIIMGPARLAAVNVKVD